MALSKISKLDFFCIYITLLPEVHVLKFPHEIRIILAKIIVSKNAFNTEVYGAGPMHMINCFFFQLEMISAQFLWGNEFLREQL